MNQFLKRSIHFFAIPFITLIIGASCDKDMSVMLDNSATSNVGVTLVDSFTVNTSTVQLWEIPTTGMGRLLVGHANVPKTGNIKSTSYFRIGFSTMDNDIPTSAVYDSIDLVLRPSHDRYYFGDTTSSQTIRVHKLTENIATRSAVTRFPNEVLPFYLTQYSITSSIFSNQEFKYDTAAIGQLTFRPRVSSLDSLTIRLDDNIGQDFFHKIKTSDARLTSYENFREYFKGLALVADDNNTVILGLSDTLQVRVNYSYPGTDGIKQSGFKNFSIVELGFQHNNITHDRSESDFAPLSVRKELPTTETDGLTYIQAGTGVVAKLAFPSLKEFLHTENMAINKAELIIETSSRTNTMYPAVSNLVLFVNDSDGVPVSIVSSSYAAGAQRAFLIPGKETYENGTYTFNLMGYLQQLKSMETVTAPTFYLSANPLSTEVGQQNARISIPPDLFRGLNTSLIASENSKPKIKLNILYTKFR